MKDTEYGNGRFSVITELKEFCLRKIHDIDTHPESDRVEIKQLRIGLKKAFKEVLLKLENKEQKMNIKLSNNRTKEKQLDNQK